MAIWTLDIENRYGEINEAHATKTLALDSLYEYVVENWQTAYDRRDDDLPATPPTDQEEAIEAYFWAFEDEEFYRITRRTVRRERDHGRVALQGGGG